MSIEISNSLEALFGCLKKNVLEKKRNLTDLPVIAVASYGMKRWLKLEFAKEGLSLGLRIVTLEQALLMTLPDIKIASKYDLITSIYHFLKKVPDEPVFEEVARYLENQGEKRVIQFAKILARNILLYSVFGHELQGWQHQLYQRLQKSPYEIRFWKEILLNAHPLKKEIHFFGFSYISPLFFNFLEKGDVNFYILSPCQTFWSDGPSPLLMSFGALGREMAKQLDGMHTAPNYTFPTEDFRLLQALKLDLLFNKDPQMAQIEDFPEEDQSIEIHELPSARREIEYVYARLLHLAENDPSFDPAKVLVVAKDITPYVPYIRAIFEKEGSSFDPILFDQPKGDKNSSYQQFERLILFGKSRLEKHLYLRLLEGQEHAEKISEFIEQAEILWGYDIEHRNSLLKEAGCQEEYGEAEGRGTWKTGFETLLKGLLLEEYPKMKDAEILGDWIESFQALYKDLRSVVKGYFTAIDWVEHLNVFADRWILGTDEEKLELRKGFQQLIPSLKMDIQLPFEMIHDRLQDSMNQKENVLGDKRLHAISFSSLFPNRAIPKDVIFFLGAQHKEFPRHEEENALNQLVGKVFFPTVKQEDRYAFLEAILSTRKHLFISYQKDKGASPVVSELLDYLDINFSIGGKKPSDVQFYKHPQESYDPSYFTGAFPTLLMDRLSYEAALYESAEKKNFLQPIELSGISNEIDLKDLYSFAKDPLKIFYLKGLRLRLKDAEFESEEIIEEFSLNALAKYGMSSFLKTGKKESAYKRAALPIRSFRDLAYQEVESFEEKLSAYGPPRTIFFQNGSKREMEISNSLLIRPAINLNGTILSGYLEDVTESGLLVDDSKSDFSIVAKAWPKLLIMAYLGLPTTLLCWKIGKEKTVEIKNPEKSLQRYVDYFHEGIRRPSPAHPNFLKTLLEKPFEEAKEIQVESPYWKFSEFNLQKEEFLFWKSYLKEVYE